jgi:copper resistance protein B
MMLIQTQKKEHTRLRQFGISLAVALALAAPPVWAQETTDSDPHAGHGSSATPMDSMNHKSMSDGDMSMDGMDMKGEMGHHTDVHGDETMDKQMDGMDSISEQGVIGAPRVQGGKPPLDARDPHAYSGGYDFRPTPRLRLGDEHSLGALWVDRFEMVRSSSNTSAAYDLQGWYGRNYDRVVIKAEGDYDNGKLESSDTELLWSHAVSGYWDAQLGARYDSGDGPNRSWLAVGMQGLAPYWFELDITAYVGDSGRTAVGLEAVYELLFTQKLIFQPRLEAMAYGKSDDARGLGSGLSDLALGLRLRYEIRREFAPYVGVEWAGTFGGTADNVRNEGQDTSEARAVAGVRFWF